jgi:two-component system, NarL family, response regulator DesR
VNAGVDQRRIRVLLAEDQVMIREALATLLGLEPDITVVGQVGRGDAVVDAVAAAGGAAKSACHPNTGSDSDSDLKRGVDVVLLDIEMPGLDGLTAAAQLRLRFPEIKIVILTTFGRPGFLRRALESGAGGFLLKDAPAEQLADAIREVHAGRRVIDPGLAAAAIADGVSPLTERERDVLAAAAEHATAAEIAAHLYLAEGTVRNYLSAAIRKLGARNRADALRIADEKGWL